MILLVGIGFGLLASLGRAISRGRRLASPSLRQAELVGLAFALQFLAFQCPETREKIPAWIAAFLLVFSQGTLLVFAWRNRNQPGFLSLGMGLSLNLLVIALNGGLMPITPEAVRVIAPQAPPGAWEVGQRFGFGKDIVLTAANTHLQFLSDCLLPPGWFPYPVAFSVGDVFIAFGAFHCLWALSGPIQIIEHRSLHYGENTMTQAESQIIEIFCRELALALRRITGRQVTVSPDALPVPIKQGEESSIEGKEKENGDNNGGGK